MSESKVYLAEVTVVLHHTGWALLRGHPGEDEDATSNRYETTPPDIGDHWCDPEPFETQWDSPWVELTEEQENEYQRDPLGFVDRMNKASR